jgi:hypothetical protein
VRGSDQANGGEWIGGIFFIYNFFY